MADLAKDTLSFLTSRLTSHLPRNHGHGSSITGYSGNHHGYWGLPSSTVDWCEPNYIVSYYIAEFFNTTSSLAMVVCGILGVMLHWKHFEWRFIATFAAVTLVGIGSVAFHCTLLFPLQVSPRLFRRCIGYS
jgi:dihydroceramidase